MKIKSYYAHSDSNDGYVEARLGGQVIRLKTNIACKRGDTLQCMVNGGKPVVIGVVGRGDEQQEQIDNVEKIADNLSSNIKNDTDENTLTLSSMPLNVPQDKNLTYGLIEISKERTKVNDPSEEENDFEIANLGWVKKYIEKVLEEKGR